jgi:AcrR family transcriptional regulator
MELDARPSRREVKKDGSRRAIAQAAVRLFEQKGFAATTMDEIAAAADVSRPTVFNYFAHKDEIPLFFVGWMLEDRILMRIGGHEPDDPVAGLCDLLAGFADVWGEFPETARTFHFLRMQELGKHLPSCRPWEPQGPMVEVLTYTVRQVERAQALGTIRNDFPARTLLGHFLIGLFASTFAPWCKGEFGDRPYGEVVRSHFRLVVEGLRA